MRVMLLIKGEPQPGAAPSEELLTAMGAYNDELQQAGVLSDLAGLLPSAEGRRVKFADGDRTVIDGPFPESKQLLAGYAEVMQPPVETSGVLRRPPLPRHGHPASIRSRVRNQRRMTSFITPLMLPDHCCINPWRPSARTRLKGNPIPPESGVQRAGSGAAHPTALGLDLASPARL